MDKYVSMSAKTSGNTFANIGFFYGLASSIFSTVYSLVLFEVFGSASLVGLYSSFFAFMVMLYTLFSGEVFRLLSKPKIVVIAMSTIIITTFCMYFPIATRSFVVLDIVREFGWVTFSICTSLFLADFAKRGTLSKLSGRYYMLYNIGSLIAPVIAMYVATKMDNMRAPFLLMCGILIICMAYFFNQKLVAAEKNVRPPRVPTTIRRIIRNLILFFRRSNMRHAYMANYGFYAIASLRSLYVPLAIISAGFSKETVGIVLSLGIIPFILIEPWIASLATKHGAKRYLILGYLTYTVFAFLASASTGFTLLGFFIIWQFSNACVEPIKEIPFFDITTKPEQSRFFGIFKTSSYVAKIITPLFASLAIYLTGSLASVWIVAGIFGIIPAYFVYKIQPKIK